MALVEWLLKELVKVGGSAALKKAVSHVQKYDEGVSRSEKKIFASQLSSTIVRSIVMGHSTLDEPLRPLIKQFHNILKDGVRVDDAERTLEIIEEAEKCFTLQRLKHEVPVYHGKSGPRWSIAMEI